MSNATSALLRLALGLAQGRCHRRLVNGAKAPGEVQADLLRRILARNADTEFGLAHGFSRITCAGDYRQAVPVQTYETLWPFIKRQELTGERCLTRARPVYYHRTSGTLGAPKNIPVTAAGLRRMKDDQRVSAYVWSKSPGVLDGKIFAVCGQAVEGRMEGGTMFGSASGLIYRNQSWFVQSKYVLPPALSDIEDYEARYLAMAVYGLAEERVTTMATANPSTFIRLLSVVHQNADAVFGAVATGRLPAAGASVQAGLRPRPSRARALADRLNAAGQLTYADIWPHLRGVITWTGGSCGSALGSLSRLLPADIAIIEWGYAASEFRGTLNMDAQANVCLPTLLTTVFEFVEREKHESGGGDFLDLHELEDGREYYVFVTTGEGLYRYDMNDIVRVNGRFFATPALEFVQKGKGVTNITGEKLTEAQVLQAVTLTLARRGATAAFFIMLAYEDAAAYTLFVEMDDVDNSPGLADEIDDRLGAANVEYEAKRKSGRLAPLGIRRLPGGTGDRYRAACVSAGQRDAQFKYLHVQYARECAFDFENAAKPE